MVFFVGMIYFALSNSSNPLASSLVDDCGHTFICFSFSLSSSEKHKAEIKDRKVLEILQSKDYKIQELEQVQYSLI